MQGRRVLVTGAGGFVGRRLTPSLVAAGFDVRRAHRGARPPDLDHVAVGDFTDPRVLEQACRDVDVVCHLAARAHVVDASPEASRRLFREANVEASRRLAEAAFASGVRRFVLVSSIGAIGHSSSSGAPLDEAAPPRPVTPYGESKLEAEGAVRAAAQSAGAEWTIVRPPLVHGPGAPGNLARIARWIDRGWPLPLAGLRNRRSLVHVDNLTRLLGLCCSHAAAANAIFHVRDPRDRSTTEIVLNIASALHRRARLWTFPPSLLRTAAGLAGKAAWVDQLTGSLQVDDSRARRVLGFAPDDGPVVV